MPAAKKPAAAKAAGKAAAPGRVIDLGAARAARHELVEPVSLRWSEDIEFTLPHELPADFAILASEGDIRGSIAALIGDQAEEFFALRPSLTDLTTLAELAGEVYGITPGEAPASAGS